jgi:hypothetical protein
MGYRPQDVYVKRGSDDNLIEAWFTLDREYTVVCKRDGLFSPKVRLYIDGREVASGDVGFLASKHSFKLNGIDCLFTVNSTIAVAAGKLGKLEVGGVTIF